MPVPRGFLAQILNAPQLRHPLPQVLEQSRATVTLRAHFQYLLLYPNLNGQLGRQLITELKSSARLSEVEPLVKYDFVAKLKYLEQILRRQLRLSRSNIFRVIYNSFAVRLLLQNLPNDANITAYAKNVHAPIGVALDNFYYFGCAPDFSNPILVFHDDTKQAWFLNATRNHQLVSRLKYVQRQSHSGKQDQFQWKKRDAAGCHRPPPNVFRFRAGKNSNYLSRDFSKRRAHFLAGVLISGSRGRRNSGMKYSPCIRWAGDPREELAELEITGYVVGMFREQGFKVCNRGIIVAVIRAFQGQAILCKGVAGMRGQKLFQFFAPGLYGLGHEV
jgi:hypothetical protein